VEQGVYSSVQLGKYNELTLCFICRLRRPLVVSVDRARLRQTEHRLGHA
jgi:hypothetical protein